MHETDLGSFQSRCHAICFWPCPRRFFEFQVQVAGFWVDDLRLTGSGTMFHCTKSFEIDGGRAELQGFV